MCCNTVAFWIWLLLGVLMILSEFVVPGFVIIFFGVGAVLTAVLTLLIPCFGITGQLLLFVVSGCLMLILARKFFPGVFKGKSESESAREDIDEANFVGECAVALSDIPENGRGKVEFHGSTWEAVAQEAVAAGETVIVLERKNLTLTVKKQ